jgi:hypothetical protein
LFEEKAMTRKDYEAIAEVIKDARDYWCPDGANLADPCSLSIACGIAAVMQTDNPRFDRDKFLTACGI